MKKLRFTILLTAVLLFMKTVVFGQVLTPGDIAIIAYQSDNPDKFAFVALVDITASAQITFTDCAWTGTALATNENTVVWTAPASGLGKGSVIIIEGTTVTGGGTATGGLTGLSTSGDQITAYQGASTSPTFVAALSTNAWITTGTPTSNQSYIPSGLTEGTNALSFTTENDNGYYSGTVTSGTKADLLAAINNSANWTKNDNIQTWPTFTFTVTGSSGDVTPPSITSVTIANVNTINVVFNETVTTASAQNTANYTGVGTVSSAVLTSSTNTVVLTLSTSLSIGVSYTLSINNVSDIIGNVMTIPYTYSFIYNNTIGNLVISEIYYNDPGASTDSLEFVELYNNGLTEIHLGGYHFASGIEFAFPSGATLAAGTYLVLSKFPLVVDAFFGITSTAWTSGSLDNAGEILLIVNTVGDTIDIVNYDDVAPWPTDPDGVGPSLQLCDMNANNNDAANWSATTYPVAGIYQTFNVLATPGSANCVPPLADLTLNVNMNVQINLGNFNPTTDFVDVAGSLNGWSGTACTDSDGDGIYTVTFTGLSIGTMYEFKFRINGDWNNAEFPGGSNRQYTIVSGTNVADYYYNDILGSTTVNILFTIEDGTQAYTDIELKGAMTGWSLVQMYDDGTNGDVTANDFIWSAVVAVATGSYDWGAIQNDGSQWGIWLINGPNLQFAVDNLGNVTGQTSYVIPAPGSLDVTFRVNMNIQIIMGAFDPVTDFVDIAGNFTGWSSSGAMDDTDGDGIYEIVITGFSEGFVGEFKFRINGDWNLAEFPGGGPNRTYTVVNGTNIFEAWYSDVSTVPAYGELFISEYIEGTSNNKALELYNPSYLPIDLSNYAIWRISNGGDWVEGQTNAVALSGILQPDSVFVIVDGSATAQLLALADLTGTTACYFNGNDAVGLAKNVNGVWSLIDCVGKPTPSTPAPANFDCAGVVGAAAEHTLIRKAFVIQGNTDWDLSAGTDPNSSEWYVLPQNTFDYLGFHPHVLNSYADVTFNVNMAHYVALGLFNPSVDFVDIAGSMNAWSAGDNLLDPEGDLIYTISFDSMTIGDILQFKFRINGSWADATAEFPFGGPNRTYTVIDGVNLKNYWYNDVTGTISIHNIQHTTLTSGDSPQKGFTVITKGVVTAALTAGYFIQDGVGLWNGIYVYDLTNFPAVGDSVTIAGLVDEYNSMTELKTITSFTINNSGNVVPIPAVCSTNTVATTEGYEGVLVKVLEAECTNVSLGFGEWSVNDGSGDCVVDDMGYVFTPTLAQAYNVTGPVYFSFSAYKIEPRSASDVEIAVTVDIQTLTIPLGWSIFSTYIIPTNALLDSVLHPIISNIVIVKNGSGQVFWPSYGINQIGNISVTAGYQIKTNILSTLDVSGDAAVPETTPINLSLGWNMFGYLRQTAGAVDVMVSSIVSNIVLVKDAYGHVYWPTYSLNGIGNMNPGQGYQAYLTVASTLYYPANSINTSKNEIFNSVPNHFIPSINTGNNMTLCIPFSSSYNLKTGDEIGVFSTDGICVGSSVYTGGNTAIAIWGDDVYTASKDEIADGELFSIRLFKNGEEVEMLVTNWITGNNLFESDGISIVGSMKLFAQSDITVSVYPNPVSDYADVAFTIQDNQYCQISLYSVSGSKVIENNEYYSAGNHIVRLDVSSLANGTYMLHLSSPFTDFTREIQVCR